MTKVFDIVIVGGGIIGAGFKRAVAHSKLLSRLKVAHLFPEESEAGIIERGRPYSNRVVSLRPLSVDFLKQNGVLNYILTHYPGRVNVYASLQVHDLHGKEALVIDNKTSGYTGMMIEQDLLIQALNVAPYTRSTPTLATNDEIKSMSNIKLKGVSFINSTIPRLQQGIVELHLEGNKKQELICDTLSAKLVVGCDGGNSIVRSKLIYDSDNMLEIEKVCKVRYNQVGLVATLTMDTTGTSGYSRDTAIQYFGENDRRNYYNSESIIALLPLSENKASLVYSHNKDYHEAIIKHLSDQDLVNYLNKLFRENSQDKIPPQIIAIDKDSRAIFPLQRLVSGHYVNQNAVILGDASHCVHPMAGLGVNIGIDGLVQLTTFLEQWILNGQNISSISTLSDYETHQQRRNMKLVLAIDALRLAYKTSGILPSSLRSLGTQLINKSDTLKLIITQLASQ